MKKTSESGAVWEGAYRRFGDAAGEAFEKALKRHRSGTGTNPTEWEPALVNCACKQRIIDNHKRETAQKRGGGAVTVSLETELSQTDYLRIADTISSANLLWGNRFALDNPEEIIVKRELEEELRQDPLELCRHRIIPQKEAAKRLGVSQSTISRRLHKKSSLFGIR